MLKSLGLKIKNLLVLGINMTAFNWSFKKFFRIFHEVLIKWPTKCNVNSKRWSISPPTPTSLLPQAKSIKDWKENKKEIRQLHTQEAIKKV